MSNRQSTKREIEIGKKWYSDSRLETWFPLYSEELSRLKAFTQNLRWIVPQPPNAITYEQGVKILDMVQAAIWGDKPLP